MVHMEKLKQHIKERRIPVATIAKELDISQPTLYRILNSDGSNITVEQVAQFERVLSLKPSETADIFFDKGSHN